MTQTPPPQTLPESVDLDPLEELNVKIRGILTRASIEIMGILPGYIQHNPARVMRLITTISVGVRDMLADVGAGDERDQDETSYVPKTKTNGLGKPLNLGPAFGLGPGSQGSMELVSGLGSALDGLVDSNSERSRSAQIRDMVESVQLAKQIGDNELVATLRAKLDLLLKSESESESESEPPPPGPIEYTYTDPTPETP